MRKLLLTAALVGLVAVVPGPAVAGGKGSTVTGSIELASGSRVASDGSTSPRYGQSVAFATTVEGRLASKSKVYVTVVCVQDGRVVYQWSADPGFTFPLQDQAGLEWNGGGASCSATLIYRIDRREDIITWLDQTSFDVAA
jgi:hypothetical protein